MSDEIVAWLREQVDADEADAVSCPFGDWSYNLIEPGLFGPADNWRASRLTARVDDRSSVFLAYGTREHDPDGIAVRHAARHDPARVLRGIAAKRAIIDEVTRLFSVNLAVDCGQTIILKALASVYTDRPGFREEWSA